MIKKVSLVNLWNRSPTDWFIVFTGEGSGQQYPWASKLLGEIQHCYAIRWDGRYWIKFNPLLGHTDIHVLDFTPKDNILSVVYDTKCCAIIRFTGWRDSMSVRNPYPTACTCVEQIKALLGIRKWFLFTPSQLFNYLRGSSDGSIIWCRQITPEF